MRINQLSGAPVGTNVFNDLHETSTNMATALRVTGNKPLGPVESVMIGAAVNDLLDALESVCRAAPGIGDAFDLDGVQDMINPDRPAWAVTAHADDGILSALEQDGYFDEFDPADRDRVRAAIESLEGSRFEVQRIGAGDLCPVGLVHHVARVVQLAVTGRSAPTWTEV